MKSAPPVAPSNGLQILTVMGTPVFVAPDAKRNYYETIPGDYDAYRLLLVDRPVYMVTGHGSKNQFGCLASVEKNLRKIVNEMVEEKGPVLLYFGDGIDAEKPALGWAVWKAKEIANETSVDLSIVGMQIKNGESWLQPVAYDMMDSCYIHSEGESRFGGFDAVTKEPVGNTKVWSDLKKAGINIKKAFFLGGGPIVIDEAIHAKTLNIPTVYIPTVPKYKLDPSDPEGKRYIDATYYGAFHDGLQTLNETWLP